MEEADTKGTAPNSDRYLQFSLGLEEYALPLLLVKEVIAIPKVTPLPQTPKHFLGIMDLRGQLIPIIDLRLKLEIKPKSSSEAAVVICDLQSMSAGLVVDSVNSVLTPLPKEMSPPPDVQGASKNPDYITGVVRRDKKLILLFDVKKILYAETGQFLKQMDKQKKAS